MQYLPFLYSLRIPRCFNYILLVKLVLWSCMYFLIFQKRRSLRLHTMKETYTMVRDVLVFSLENPKMLISKGILIPRLDLCPAVLAVEFKKTITDALDVNFDFV